MINAKVSSQQTSLGNTETNACQTGCMLKKEKIRFENPFFTIGGSQNQKYLFLGRQIGYLWQDGGNKVESKTGFMTCFNRLTNILYMSIRMKVMSHGPQYEYRARSIRKENRKM